MNIYWGVKREDLCCKITFPFNLMESLAALKSIMHASFSFIIQTHNRNRNTYAGNKWEKVLSM